MKPEFEQLLNGLGFKFYEDGILETSYLSKKDFQELMESVWNMAIEEAASNGECDCEIPSDIYHKDAEKIECALNRSSILKLKI